MAACKRKVAPRSMAKRKTVAKKEKKKKTAGECELVDTGTNWLFLLRNERGTVRTSLVST